MDSENETIWFKSGSETFTFADVLRERSYYPESAENEAVYFFSDGSTIEILKYLALWLNGWALVPISKKWSRAVKERLIKISNARFIEDIPRNTTVDEELNHEGELKFTPGKICLYIQTSGTNALPKVVGITNKMLETAVKTTSFWMPAKKGDSWLLNLPVHHIGGMSVLLRAWFMGYTVYQPNNEDWKSLIFTAKVHYASLVSTQLKQLCEFNEAASTEFKRILLGGGPVPKTVLQKALQQGYVVVNSYGMTETAAQITGFLYEKNSLHEAIHVGKPVFNEFKITEEEPPFKESLSGLLWLKGEQVAKIYQSEDELQVIDGWFCTGDFAELTEDGNIAILMRRTDRIVSGGENINPIEVETVLENHPSIKEALVTGIEDETWGQKAVALLVCDKMLEEKELQHWLLTKLESYKVPKRFFLVNAIPRISISKKDRKKALEIVKKEKLKALR